MFDVHHIVQAGGLLAIAAILFAETGLLVGFFLPGDTLLIAAGVFAANHQLSIWLLLPIAAVSSIIGYQVGYKIGEKAGPRVFSRKGGILFREDYIDRTKELINRHGIKAIMIARFLVIVRTIVPLMAGMGKMNKRKFFIINVLGGVLWTGSVIMGAYWVGSKINNIDKYLVYMLIVAMVLTSGTILLGLMNSKAKRKELASALKEELSYLFAKTKKSK